MACHQAAVMHWWSAVRGASASDCYLTSTSSDIIMHVSWAQQVSWIVGLGSQLHVERLAVEP